MFSCLDSDCLPYDFRLYFDTIPEGQDRDCSHPEGPVYNCAPDDKSFFLSYDICSDCLTNLETTTENTAACYGKKYKKVADRMYLVKGTLPKQFQIVHHKHPNPLANMPQLPVHPPDFSPGLRYTQERHNALDVNLEAFLWDEEVKLVEWLVKEQENAFAWEEAEKGRFDPEYFDPILLPTLDHIPWVFQNIPIPPGIYDKVLLGQTTGPGISMGFTSLVLR
jgi:hypothetical protein